MAKIMVGYCPECDKRTKHKKIECTESLAWRTFEIAVTLGWGLLFNRDYECECSVCGSINTLTKG